MFPHMDQGSKEGTLHLFIPPVPQPGKETFLRLLLPGKHEHAQDRGEGEGDENGDENIPDDDSNKWSLIEYRNNFNKIGKGYIMDLIWGQIEAIVIKTVISVSTEYYKNIFPKLANLSFNS